MKILLKFELKKILQKKSTWIALVILLAIQITLAISANLGSVYIDGEFVETHMERNQKNREYGIALSGRTIDQTLLEEMQDANPAHARRYQDLYSKLNGWLAGQETLSVEEVNENDLYQIRKERQNAMYKAYGLTEDEIAYWERQEEQLPKRFTYEYAAAYEQLVSMNGGYMSLMLLTFFIAVTMGNVFVDEHTRKTNQIIQCTRNGKGKLYLAKILAGSIVSFVVSLLFLVVLVIGKFICFGPEGFGAEFQVTVDFFTSCHLTVGQVFFIISGIVLLASVLIGILTMVLAETWRNSIGAMAVIIGGLFAARLVMIPASWGIFSQLWNLIPINLVKLEQGYLDLRLFSIGGLQLTGWQLAPFIYILIGGIAVLLGKYCYCRNRD